MADSQRHDGPSLSLLAVTCIALLFGGLAIGVALGGIMPLPYGPVAPIQHYVQPQSLAVHIIALAGRARGPGLPVAGVVALAWVVVARGGLPTRRNDFTTAT